MSSPYIISFRNSARGITSFHYITLELLYVGLHVMCLTSRSRPITIIIIIILVKRRAAIGVCCKTARHWLITP